MPISNERHRKLVDWVIKNDSRIVEMRKDILARGFAIGVVITSIIWLIALLIWHLL